MKLLGVDVLRSESVVANASEGLAKAKMAALRAKHGDDVFLVNFQLPGKVRRPPTTQRARLRRVGMAAPAPPARRPSLSRSRSHLPAPAPRLSPVYVLLLVSVAGALAQPGHVSLLLWYGLSPTARVDAVFYPLWREFCDSPDDAFRASRLKLMVIIPDGPFLLRKAVPGNKPVILGKAIHIDWCRGEGYLEADINISSSSAATKMWGMVQSVAKASRPISVLSCLARVQVQVQGYVPCDEWRGCSNFLLNLMLVAKLVCVPPELAPRTSARRSARVHASCIATNDTDCMCMRMRVSSRTVNCRRSSARHRVKRAAAVAREASRRGAHTAHQSRVVLIL